MSTAVYSPENLSGSRVVQTPQESTCWGSIWANKANSWTNTMLKVTALVVIWGGIGYLVGSEISKNLLSPLKDPINKVIWWASWTPTLLMGYGIASLGCNVANATANLYKAFKK